MAIYGMGVMGRHFYKELKDNDIIIDYIIDRRKDEFELGEPFFQIHDKLPETEMIIVTVSVEAPQIVMILSSKMHRRSMSLEDIMKHYGI